MITEALLPGHSPQRLVYNRSETAVPFNFVFKLHSVWGLPPSLGKDVSSNPSGEVLRKRTVSCPPPHSLPPTHLHWESTQPPLDLKAKIK